MNENLFAICEITHVPKPWGYELIFAKTSRYVGKILHINRGESLSLQYHEIKEETLFVVAGELKLTIEVDGDRRELPLEIVHLFYRSRDLRLGIDTRVKDLVLALRRLRSVCDRGRLRRAEGRLRFFHVGVRDDFFRRLPAHRFRVARRFHDVRLLSEQYDQKKSDDVHTRP